MHIFWMTSTVDNEVMVCEDELSVLLFFYLCERFLSPRKNRRMLALMANVVLATI